MYFVNQSYGGYGVDHSVGDLILPHVFHHVELSRPLLGDDLVGDFLQLRVELFKQIFKQQRQELQRETDDNTRSSSQLLADATRSLNPQNDVDPEVFRRQNTCFHFHRGRRCAPTARLIRRCVSSVISLTCPPDPHPGCPLLIQQVDRR